MHLPANHPEHPDMRQARYDWICSVAKRAYRQAAGIDRSVPLEATTDGHDTVLVWLPSMRQGACGSCTAAHSVPIDAHENRWKFQTNYIVAAQGAQGANPCAPTGSRYKSVTS